MTPNPWNGNQYDSDLHAQESSALKARLSRQQAYLDASQEHGIAAE